MEYRLLTLSDGRDLEYATNALPSSCAVVFHQGTLCDLSEWTSWLHQFERLGVRALAFNRSGYGRSSGKDGRVTLDVGHDVAQLADHLGLRAFVSVGWSGGGSHALATSIDSRCTGVVTLAGIAPFARDDLDFYEGMKNADIDEYDAALRDIDELVSLIDDPEHGNEWCEPDRIAMASPAMDEVNGAIERALSFGRRCLVDDYSSYLSAWGFDVEEITVPVVIFQGDADENVPVAHAKWLTRHIKGSQLRLYPGEGHMSLVFSHRDDIVATIEQLLGPHGEISE